MTSSYPNETPALLDDLDDETLNRMQASAQEHTRWASDQRDLAMLGITPRPAIRYPEPAQVRDRWED
jgi:hypothetical protein